MLVHVFNAMKQFNGAEGGCRGDGFAYIIVVVGVKLELEYNATKQEGVEDEQEEARQQTLADAVLQSKAWRRWRRDR